MIINSSSILAIYAQNDSFLVELSISRSISNGVFVDVKLNIFIVEKVLGILVRVIYFGCQVSR